MGLLSGPPISRCLEESDPLPHHIILEEPYWVKLLYLLSLASLGVSYFGYVFLLALDALWYSPPAPEVVGAASP